MKTDTTPTPTGRWYIRATGATPENCYWMQGAQNWTTSPFSATLFDSEQQATDELEGARLEGEAEVKQQHVPAYKVVTRDGPLTRLRKANARSKS